MEEIREQKKELRSRLKAKAANLPEAYCRMADEGIREQVCALAEFEQADVIFCYVGTDREINTVPILQEIWKRGKKPGVPKCISRGVMKVYEIQSMDDLEEGAYGILEPKNGCREIKAEEIDLALIPCLAAARDGRRLGYGGGYYDRYLEKAGFFKAVLCREQMLEEQLQGEGHDVQMDAVISEKTAGYVRKHTSYAIEVV